MRGEAGGADGQLKMDRRHLMNVHQIENSGKKKMFPSVGEEK
jgi:hypothetical protein